MVMKKYWGADKSLARPTSRCILFDGENISFDASLVIYIYIYIYVCVCVCVCVCEGWNFNSGNYLFTTDTK